jgi:uncharacterized membrane protein
LSRLSKEVTVHSPASRVWRILEKHLEHPEVSPINSDPGKIQESRGEAISEQRSGVGTRTRWFYTYNRKPLAWDDVVTEWEPEKKIAWETSSGWEMKDSFTLEPADGGTRLIYEMKYHLPYGPIGWLYGKLVLEPRMKRHLSSVLQRTKNLCENPLG